MEADNVLASVLLIIGGIPALYFNMLLVLPIFGTTKPFELICACHAIGNLVVTTAMVLCLTPMIFFNWNNSTLLRISGSADRYGFFLLHFTQITLAANRFMAIYCTERYNIIFSTANTKKMLVILIVCLSPFFFIGFLEDCAFYFVLDTLQFSFGMGQCGLFFGSYFDLYFTIAIFVASSVLDLFTALGIYCYSRNNALSARRFTQSDVIFFMQCCASNAILIGCFLLIYHLHAIYQDRLGAFLITTFIMQVTHLLDGMAVVLLNRNIRTHILKPHKLLQSKNTSHNRWST